MHDKKLHSNVWLQKSLFQLHLAHKCHVPDLLPDSDLLTALWRLSLEAAAFVEAWRRGDQWWKVSLILGGRRRQETHLSAVYKPGEKEKLERSCRDFTLDLLNTDKLLNNSEDEF